MAESERNTALMMICTFFSRVLGILKNRALSVHFGAGPVADAMNFSFNLANSLRKLFAEGSLGQAYLPLLAEGRKDDERAERLMNQILSLLVLIFIVLLLFSVLLGRQTVDFLGDWEDARSAAVAASLLPWFTIFLFFISSSILVQSVLQTRGRFLASALAPLMFSLVLLVSLMVLPDHIAHYSMAVGAVAGALAEFYSVFIPLRRLGFRFRLTLDFSGHDFRSVISRWIPGSLSSLVAIVSQSVTMYLASSLGTGGLSALSNSIIFYQAPYGIVFSAVQSVFYPQLSAAADEKERALRLSSALEYLYTFLLPATLILLPLMQLMIASLLQKGAFSAADTLLTAQVLGWYLAAMVPMSFYAMLQRLLMSRGEYRLNLLVTSLVSVLDMVLMIVLMNCGCGISSLSLATFISSTAGAAVLFVRAGDFPWKSFLCRIARITGANALTVILALCYIKWNPQDWLAGSSIVNVMHFVFRAAVMLLSTVLGYVLLRVDFITQLRSRRHGLR